MSLTESEAAAAFFADLLLPLRYANSRRGIAYLDLDRRQESGWGPIVSRTGGIENLSGADCDPLALLDALGRYWAQRNDQDLIQLLPYLRTVHEKLSGRARADDQAEPPLTEFVYPIF